MRKLIVLLLAVLCLLTLGACHKAPAAPTEPTRGAYWDDASVLVIEQGDDINDEQVVSHYQSGGILLVKDWSLAARVQALVATTVTTDFTSEDVAVVFYQTDSGTPATGIVGGNSSDWDREIDDMIATAKANQ